MTGGYEPVRSAVGPPGQRAAWDDHTPWSDQTPWSDRAPSEGHAPLAGHPPREHHAPSQSQAPPPAGLAPQWQSAPPSYPGPAPSSAPPSYQTPASYSAPAGYPASPGYPTASGYPGSAGYPPAPPAPGRRRGLTMVTFVLATLLVVVAATQTYALVRLNDRVDRLAATSRDNDAAHDDRLRGLESRVKELEGQAGKTLDAAAVAAQVKPSVFRVIAGRSSGTAFAFGKEPAGGGTDLMTNFHVVRDLYNGGGRDVALERDNKRYNAKIVKVDDGKDMAVLHTAEVFVRLPSSPATARPGEPIVVIGSPLGLQDTVTTGVVSAVRQDADGPRVQFDAPINPGNSGGPVINAQRQVVGIATAKARAAEGIGMAIPILLACETFANC